MCSTIRSQYYRLTVETIIFRDFLKNRKTQYGTPRGWTFFISKNDRVRYGKYENFDLFTLIQLLFVPNTTTVTLSITNVP